MADFIKNAIEKEELGGLEQKAQGFLGGNSSSESKESKGSNESKESNSNNSNQESSGSTDKYGKYVSQGVQYAEKNVFNIDTSKMSDSQKATEKKVETFINKEINEYTSKN